MSGSIRGLKSFSKSDVAPCGRQQASCSPPNNRKTAAGRLWNTAGALLLPASHPLPSEKLTQRILRLLWAQKTTLDKTLLKPEMPYWCPSEHLWLKMGIFILLCSWGSFFRHLHVNFGPVFLGNAVPPLLLSHLMVEVWSRQGQLCLWTFQLLPAGGQVRNNRNMTSIIRQLISIKI